MAGEIGSAFVRIRPDLSSFKPETEGGIRSAFSGIGRVVGGLLAIGGAAEAAKAVIGAAQSEETALATVRQSVESTNATWVVHGRTVGDILQQQARDAGFSLSEVGAAFVRLETGTKNTATSLKDLGLAQDISRARGIELAQAAGILARAEQGADGAIRKLGIIVPKVTTNVSELKKEHTAATAAGVKFTAAQTDVYKSSLAQAKGLDAQASKTRVLAEVQARFGGQSARFATTSAGEFARLRENISQFEAGVGRDLLPVLNDGFKGLSHWVDELRQSEGVHQAVTSSVHAFAEGVRTAKGAVEFFVPGLKVVAQVIGEIGQTAGAGGILAFAAGFKSVSTVVSVAGSVQERYQQILAAGATSQNAVATGVARETAAYGALTTELSANTVAMERNALVGLQSARAVGASTVASITQAGGAYLNLANGISTAGAASVESTAQIADGANAASESILAVSADAAVLGDSVSAAGSRLAETGTKAAGLGSKLGAVGRGLFALAGGWTTIAAVGIGAVAFGLFKLFTQETELEKANDRLAASFGRLDEGLARSAGLAKDYSSALSSIKSDRVAVQVAEANVALARQALATTDAAKGSAEYQSLVAQLASSIDALRVAERSLSGDEARAASARRARTAQDVKNERERGEAIQKTIELSRLASNAQAGSAAEIAFRDKAVAAGTLTDHAARIIFRGAAAAREFADGLEKDADKLAKGNPPLRAQVLALAEFSRILGHLPTDQTISVVLNAGNAREALVGIVDQLERVRPKVNQFADALKLEARSVGASNPALAKRLQLLADFSREVGRLPTKHETEVALKTPTFKAAVDALASVLAQLEGRATEKGFESGKAFAESFARGEQAGGLFGAIAGIFAAAGKLAAGAATAAGDVAAGSIKDAQNNLDAAKTTLKGNDAKVAEARTASLNAARDLRDANRSLADAITGGAQQIRDAVGQASQNLFSIGSSLSDAISQFLDAQEKAGKLSGVNPKQLAAFKTLRQQILEGGGGDEAARAAQRLAGEIENGQGGAGDVEKRKEKVKRDIADLVAEFNKGAITLSTFNRRLAALLAREGISYKAAGRTLGVAFADGFRAQVEGLKTQAAAINAGPRIRGVTGLEPTIVRPLEAVRASQRQIADAQERRDAAALAEAKAEKHLSSLEEQHTRLALAESRAQTRLTRLNERHLRFLLQESKKQTAALNRQQPTKPVPLRSPRPAAVAANNARIMAEHGFAP